MELAEVYHGLTGGVLPGLPGGSLSRRRRFRFLVRTSVRDVFSQSSQAFMEVTGGVKKIIHESSGNQPILIKE